MSDLCKKCYFNIITNISTAKKELKLVELSFLQNDFERVGYLANLLTARATGLSSDEDEYLYLRHLLLQNASIAPRLPAFVRQSRSLDLFWSFIQPKFKSYAERRTFISEQFTPLLDLLEFNEPITQPIDPSQVNFKNKMGDNLYGDIEVKNNNMNLVARNKRKVFIVHGRDNSSKQEVSRFISQLGLEPIILHEQANSGMTIIEKIERYSNEADFALVLYTPCDKGRGIHESHLPPKDRARQNVVFEHGYLMAKLGRENVCALVKNEIETPNDISGVVYVPLDELGGWKIAITTELKSCGYQIKSLI